MYKGPYNIHVVAVHGKMLPGTRRNVSGHKTQVYTSFRRMPVYSV